MGMVAKDASGTMTAGTYEALVRSLYDNLTTLVAGAVFGSFAVMSVAAASGVRAMWLAAGAMAAIGAGRVGLTLAFRHVRPATRARGMGLRPWRIAYAAGANAFSLAFGTAGLVAMLLVDDPVFHMVVSTSAVGYAAGIAGRNSGCLDVSLTQLWAVMVPLTAGFALHGGAGYHMMIVTAAGFALGVSSISMGINRLLLDAYRTADERRELAARLDSAVSTMRHGFCVFGQNGGLEICSEAIATILRIPAPSPGDTMDDVVDACLDAGTRAPEGILLRSLLRGLVRTSGHRSAELPLRDGRTLAVTASPRAGGGCVLVVDDITERLGDEAAKAMAARLDPVTGLLNRASMESALAVMLADGRPVAALFIDLDRFKPVNDTHGHGVGDALLRAVGARLAALVPEGALAARLGGDEFVLVLEGSREDVARLAGDVVGAIDVPFEVEGREISVSASVGTAIAPVDGRDPIALMRNADTALYSVKEAGRCGWRAYGPEMDAERDERRLMEADLDDALSLDALGVAYQPQVDLATGRVTACEALVRWDHPRLGSVPPDRFIPLAEETGLIHRVGRAVLERACADAVSWPGDVRVAVNLSAVQFRHDLAATVGEILARTGLPGSRLELEVTETVFMEDAAELQATLLRLSAMGVRIALDDFGTGYSSLGYLRSFPFRKVKLDRSFVEGLDEGPESLAIIRAMTRLGRDLGMEVVVEGVETEAQLRAVAGVGCGAVQGYLFSRPVPSEAVAGVLSHAFQASRAA